MPEEINRMLTDAISDFLFSSEQSGVDNLLREGVPKEKIFLVGNVMIDTLLKYRSKAEASKILDELGLKAREYAVLTLHRPSNVDDTAAFDRILRAVEVIQRDMPVVFPIHPRTRKNLEGLPLGVRMREARNLRVIEPAGYLEFLKLMSSAKLVLTDSGGIQEETTILNGPCLTLRENTERPVTVTLGTSRLVGSNTEKILSAYKDIVAGQVNRRGTPDLWDGKAAQRIVRTLAGGP
jgi:UDP-N-acetylglucosamine 2-epimerase (non-hydrolysing)